jgi:hypothetical protein
MLSISRAGSMRSPVIVVGRFTLKFAQNARGRASNLYEANYIEMKTPRAVPYSAQVSGYPEVDPCRS